MLLDQLPPRSCFFFTYITFVLLMIEYSTIQWQQDRCEIRNKLWHIGSASFVYVYVYVYECGLTSNQ